MWPNTTKPAVSAAMAVQLDRVNGERESVTVPNVPATKPAQPDSEREFDKLTARIDVLQRENRDLKRAAENPKPEYIKEGQIEIVPLKAIIRDAGTQSRALLDEKTVERYMADMEAGDKFPPLRGVQTGEGIVLRDGFHRFEAMTRLGWKDCRMDVIQGSVSDAIWLSLSANKEHDKAGLARSNGDKRRAVERALAHPNAQTLSDREIARHVGVDHKTVAAHRKVIWGNSPDSTPANAQPSPSMTAPATPHFPQPAAVPPRMVTRGNTTYPMNTGNIGTKPSAPARTQVRTDEFSQRAPDDVPMVDDDADGFGDLPPYDDTPDLAPAVPKVPPTAPVLGAPNLPPPAPRWPAAVSASVPQQISEAERAAALALRQQLHAGESVQASADGDRDYWPDVMMLRDALVNIKSEVTFAFGMSNDTKRKIFQIIEKALATTSH